jgi:hypothetical protein
MKITMKLNIMHYGYFYAIKYSINEQILDYKNASLLERMIKWW